MTIYTALALLKIIIDKKARSRVLLSISVQAGFIRIELTVTRNFNSEILVVNRDAFKL